MKKTLIFLITLVMLFTFTLPCFATASTSGAPVIVDTLYPTEDVVLADIIITEAPYNADNTGKEDVTAIIQKAIDACFENGGGTVWLPKGEYRVTGNIYIKKFVTLRGEYQDPDEGKDYGTIVIADVPSSKEMRPALFNLGASAGAIGLTVWYPEQSIDNVKPYPYTFYIEGNGDYMLQTIKNCTLLNSYRGIGASSQCETGIQECHEMMLLENVKGTCLFEGLHAYNSADVDRIKTLYFSNKYWADAGEKFNAPDETALNEYTRKNGYGFVFGDLEWPEIADVKISNMLYGIHFKPGFRYTFSGSFTDLEITDCDYGIYIPEESIFERGKTWGLSIANGTIEGSKYAILHECTSAVQLTNVTVNGETKGKNIEILDIDTASLSPDYKLTYKKVSGELYIIDADKTGKTDASVDIQKKLNEAKNGGVVLLPAGLYRLDKPITVPAGVEFRGASSVANRCQRDCSNGTLIISYYGFNENDKPLITLAGKNAGITGIRVDYPLNNPVDESPDYKKTSPAIYSEADDIYITNCTITLATDGIRLKNCQNAFLKNIVSCCIDNTYTLTECDNAVIEGCHQNANTLPRNGYNNFDLKDLQNRIQEENIFEYYFIPKGRPNTTFITLKNCESVTVFNTFIYGGRSFLDAENSTATFTNVGHDGSTKEAPALILSGGKITFLNSMRSTDDGRLCQNFYSIENDTEFRSYNSQAPGMEFKEKVILENAGESILEGEESYKRWEPFFRLIRAFNKWYMEKKQS